jgi:hypothetical protein
MSAGLRLPRQDMPTARFAVVLAVFALSTACATIAHGSRQTVTVVSDPPGATVTVLSAATVTSTPGVTPIQLHLSRRDSRVTVRLEKDGCASVEVPLTRSTSGWVASNLVFANPLAMQGYDQHAGAEYAAQVGLVGLMIAVDFGTGAAYKLPKVVSVPICR